MRSHESVNEVKEDSWTCCTNKKRHGELEQLLATGGATWQGGEKPAGVGRAAGG
jgi:hypothetical protein